MPLTLALPKGRLMDQIQQWLLQAGFAIDLEDRQLVAEDSQGEIRVLLVKNADLPVYVHHGIAGLGICGDDLLYEANLPLYRLMELPFGSTRLCLAAREGCQLSNQGRLRVASKFTRFTRDYFHERNMPVDIIRLNGSVELAAVLGLTPYIVDLVETGETLKANKLTVLEELRKIKVHLIANPAYYKYHYKIIRNFMKRQGGHLYKP